MHNVLRMSRRAFTVAVVAATIAWSIGLAALVTPLTANAAASGDLVRGSLPAVYYVGADGKRYVFANQKTYDTWYADFSGVQVITDAELAAMPIGGNVTYKPGARMVKIQTDPKTYAVDMNGTLRWVKDEATATCLYGAAWNTMIDDVPDAFFVNYTIGADINACGDFDPAAAGAASPDINTDKGLSSMTEALTVTASSMMPAGSTLPLGAMGVNVLKFDVMNGSAAATTVDSLTLHRTGPGVAGDWSAVYVYRGNDRLTTGRTINATSNEVTIGGLNLSIPAGGTETLWIAGDVKAAATPGNVHAFQLSALTSGTVSATGVPVMGPSFSISGAPAGNMAIAPTGTLSNIQAGATGAKMGQFQLTANVENQNVNKVTLTYNGTVTRDNISNLVLKQAGTTLATVASINSKDQVVFVLPTPFAMERGDVRTFEVYGDLSGSARAAQNINFYLDQNADLLSVGQTYGYGVTVASTYTVGAAGATATVEAGKLNMTFNGPAASNIAQRAQDVELFNVTMTPQSNLEVRKTVFAMAFGAGAAAADFSDVKLVDTATGQVVAGPYNAAAAVTMTEVINLTSGVSRTFKLTADVENTAPNLGTVTATLNAFGATDVRNLDNSTYLTPATDIVPSAAIVGNAHTVQVPMLSMVTGSTPVAQTFIQGTQGAPLMSVGLTSGDASAIKVSTIVVTGYVDADQTAGDMPQGQDIDGAETKNITDILLSGSLWNGSTQVGTSESPSTSTAPGNGGVLTFDNLNLTVPAGQTVSLLLKGNLAGNIANLGDDVRFDIAVNGDVTASDPDGNTVVPTGAVVTGPVMSIAGAGTLSVALAPDDADTEAGLVIGGTSNAVLGKLKYTAQNEELKITKSQFIVTTPAAVSSLSLYDGSTLVGGPVAVSGAGIAYFSSVNFVIPKDSSKVLTVKGNLNSVGVGGATTGSNAKVTFDWNTNFEARGTGAGSSTLLTTVGAANVPMNAKIMRKTKPSISLVSLPSTVLTTGDVVTQRFTVAADAAGDVSMKHMAFNISPSLGGAWAVVATTGSSLRRVGDSTNLAGGALITGNVNGAGTCSAAGAGDTLCELNIGFTNEEVISAGTSRTYDLRLNITGTLVSGNSLSSNILGDSTAVETGVLVSGGADDYSIGVADSDNFTWSDNSIVPHADTVGGPSADWSSGMYAKVLPTDTQTMSK